MRLFFWDRKIGVGGELVSYLERLDDLNELFEIEILKMMYLWKVIIFNVCLCDLKWWWLLRSRLDI